MTAAAGASPGGALTGVHRAARAAGYGIYLGHGAGGWAWAQPERSTLVLGPSRAGKTSALIVPNVLAAPGCVVSTSTKPDVLRQTAPARSEHGWCLVFDPSGTVATPPDTHRVGWSPVTAARTWDGALTVADAMVRATRRRRGGAAGPAADEHWTERAGALLAPVLHAAARANEPMRTVLHWVDRHDGSTALDLLAGTASGVAADVLAGIVATDGREQSGIWSTASGVLAAYRSEAALRSTEPPYVDVERLCDGPHTLYICAAGADQQLYAPLVVGLLTEIRDAAYRRARTSEAAAPVLLALDEAANIAPLPDLPSIVTEGAGQGLLTLASLQDLSQARARWGTEGAAFFSLFGTSVVLGGIADVPTLDTLSALGGDEEVVRRSVGWSRAGGRPNLSVTDATSTRRRLPVDVLARGLEGWALAIDARNRMGWVRLTPAYEVSPWCELTIPTRTLDRTAPVQRGCGRC